jgi:hypothetical protein
MDKFPKLLGLDSRRFGRLPAGHILLRDDILTNSGAIKRNQAKIIELLECDRRVGSEQQEHTEGW